MKSFCPQLEAEALGTYRLLIPSRIPTRSDAMCTAWASIFPDPKRRLLPSRFDTVLQRLARRWYLGAGRYETPYRVEIKQGMFDAVTTNAGSQKLTKQALPIRDLGVRYCCP